MWKETQEVQLAECVFVWWYLTLTYNSNGVVIKSTLRVCSHYHIICPQVFIVNPHY